MVKDVWKRVLVGISVEEDNMTIVEGLPFAHIGSQEIAPVKTLAHQIKVLMTKVYNTVKDIAVEYHSVYIISDKTTMMSWYYDTEDPVANEAIFKEPNEWRTLSTESDMIALESETDPQRIIDICVKPLENIKNGLQCICRLVAKYSDEYSNDDSKERIQMCIHDINDIVSEIPTYPNVPDKIDTSTLSELMEAYYRAEYGTKVKIMSTIKQLIDSVPEDKKKPELIVFNKGEPSLEEHYKDIEVDSEKAKEDLEHLKIVTRKRPPRVQPLTVRQDPDKETIGFWETMDNIMIHLARIYRWTDEVITAVTHWKGLVSYVGYKKSCDGTRTIRGTIKEWYKPLVASLKEISKTKPVPSYVEAKYLNSDPDKIDLLLSGDEQLIISGILDKNPGDILDVYNDMAFYYPTIKDIWHKLDFISKDVEPEHREAMVGLMNALLNIISDLVVAEKVSDKSICSITLVRTVDTEAKVLAGAAMRECILHAAVINETIRRLDNCTIKHNFGKLRSMSAHWFEKLGVLDMEYSRPAMNRASEIVVIAKDGRCPLDDIEKNVIDRFKSLYDELDKYMDFVPNTSEEYKIAYSVFNEVITYGRIHGYMNFSRFA